MKASITTLIATAAAATLVAGAANAQDLRLMTGPQGGSWYPLGGAIQNIVQNGMDGVSVQVLPGGGIANVKGIATGRADVAFANSVSTVDAIEGRGAFEERAENVCNVATLYPQYFQIVTLADSGIESVGDLAGKALATQPRGNTAEDITRGLLEAAGLTYDDMSQMHFVSYSDGVSLMKDGNAAAMTLGTTVPASAIMDLASGSDIKMLSLDEALMNEMQSRNPGYQKLTIPAGSYPGQDEDVQVIGYATHVVARCDLDEEIVHGMLAGMVENLGDLQAIAGAMKGLTPEQMAQDVGVPMHEGAKRFYEEQGVM
ncbi:TAXI family TRAP transporter solute-binding subunit [Salinarimonas ramus]|uniref:C4-dicarboxylate ABC transporter substrate-binding protein n=1 Tax=Salinarimonas ramus TaxID=690164 RepID=A0A917V371_9HYPH|nr:TAXI family TRAP transporter solute-binding subunit [Salinarimonas ramus]GGK27813.1 C4-dicarboxylate ABC transporter substrate-binding protein [Salinarimonas ramus]